MSILYGTNAPKQEDLDLWWDMSSPLSLNTDILFLSDFSTTAQRRDAFKEYFGSTVSTRPDRPTRLRLEHRGDIFGYKDISGNENHCQIAAGDHLHMSRVRVVLPFLDADDKWYFNATDGMTNWHLGATDDSKSTGVSEQAAQPMKEFFFSGQTIATESQLRYAPYSSGVSDTIARKTDHGASNWFAPKIGAGSQQNWYGLSGFPGGDNFVTKYVDSNKLINGRPVNAMYARINHNSVDTGWQDGPRYRWEIVIDQQATDGIVKGSSIMVAGSGLTPIAPKLKPYDIVDCGSYGEWEIGPALIFSPANADYDDATNSVIDLENANSQEIPTVECAGHTWHPIRPAKGNTSFPQPKWGFNEFQTAKMPLRPNPKHTDHHENTFIIRDLEFRAYNPTYTNEFRLYGDNEKGLSIFGDAATGTADLWDVNPDGSGPLNVGDPDHLNTLWVRRYGSGSTSGQTTFHFHKLLMPEIAGGSETDDWNMTEVFLYDDQGTLHFWGNVGNSANDSSSKIKFYGNGNNGEYDPTKGRGSLATISVRNDDIYYCPSRFEYLVKEYTETPVLNNAGDEFIPSGRKWNLVIVRKTDTATTSAFPPVEYDNPVAGTPGYLPIRGHSQVAVTGEKFRIDENNPVNEISFATWFKLPGVEMDTAVKYDRDDWMYDNDIALIDVAAGFQVYIVTDGPAPSTSSPLFGPKDPDDNKQMGNRYIRVQTIGSNNGHVVKQWQSEIIPELRNRNTWNHVAVTHSVSQNALKIYLNGKELDQLAVDDPRWTRAGDQDDTMLKNETFTIDKQYQTGTSTINPGLVGNISCLMTMVGARSYHQSGWGGGTVNNSIWNGAFKFSEEHQKKSYFDVGCVQVWKSNTLTSSEIKDLFESAAPRFGANVAVKNLFDDFDKPSVNVRDFSKDTRHVPRNLDLKLNTFTAQTPVSTVVEALEDMTGDGIGHRLPQFNVFAVLDQDHIGSSLPVITTAYDFASSSTVKNDVGFYVHRTMNRLNSGYGIQGSAFWGDPVFIDGEDSFGSSESCPLYIGMAAFDDEKYLGSTFMFFPTAGSPNNYPKSGGWYNGNYQIGPYNSNFRSSLETYQQNYYLSSFFEQSFTNPSGISLNDSDYQNKSVYIEGYTHDVSGHYQVNGKPSSIDNPYIVKTSPSGENSMQGWVPTVDSGHFSSAYYDASSMTLGKNSSAGYVWGWKPNDVIRGYRLTPQTGFWGIGTFNGNDAENGHGSWGPNKTYATTDNVKFYCFAQVGNIT